MKIIYVVTSYGLEANSNKTVEIEIARLPPLTVPAPLYVEGDTNIQSNSAYIFGTDDCGSDDKPAVSTTLGTTAPTVGVGVPPDLVGAGGTTGEDAVTYNDTDLDIQYMIDLLKSQANFSYNLANGDFPTSGNFTLSPAGDWGTPIGGDGGGPSSDPPDASTCSEYNIVWFDAAGTAGNGIGLTGGEKGCGILIVEGNLSINGSFDWHGLILVSGNFQFTGGGGQDKIITGALLSGGGVPAGISWGKNKSRLL